MEKRPECYICPNCGGQCDKLATRVQVKWDMEQQVYHVIKDRICGECGHEWLNLAYDLSPVEQGQ